MLKQPGRVGSYLTKYADSLVFDQFQDKYLRREGLADFMRGVPVPLRTEDVVDFHGKQGLQVMNVAKNMIRIIGINPEFPYVEPYLKYIRKYFDSRVAEAVIHDGEQRAQRGDTEEALIYFRAALLLCENNPYALYDYGLACRKLYEAGEEGTQQEEAPLLPEAYRGALKADSIQAFEELAVSCPDFFPAYYYLGYIYLNMGLYTKAQLAFQTFLQLSKQEGPGGDGAGQAKTVAGDADMHIPVEPGVLAQQRIEVQQRIDQLSVPVCIEGGINHILAGRLDAGLRILEPCCGGPCDQWWPLHYYLGIAYAQSGRSDLAEAQFRRTLQLSPSHTQTMQELVNIYEARGDRDMSEKYRNKIALIQRNAEQTDEAK